MPVISHDRLEKMCRSYPAGATVHNGPLMEIANFLRRWGAPVDNFTITNPDDHGFPTRLITPDRASAEEILGEIRNVLMQRGGVMSKLLRPWDLDRTIFDSLDRSQPWWGFELETGWRSQAAQQAAIAYTWDNFEGVTYDSEGEGRFPVEITFLPSEMSKYLDGTAPILQFIDWMDANADKVFFTGENNIGTHWNMSHPAFTNDVPLITGLASFLNATLKWCARTDGHRQALFGRELLYGGFYVQNGGSLWLECKAFRTVYTREQFNVYIQTCTALMKCVELFLQKYKDSGLSSEEFQSRIQSERAALFGGTAFDGTMGVNNLFDVTFNGAEPIVEKFMESKVSSTTSARFARGV